MVVRPASRLHATENQQQTHPQPGQGPATAIASWRVSLLGAPEIALLVQLRQFPQTLLQFLPGSYTLPRGSLRRFRHVVARGLALFAPVADLQVRTMLGSRPVAMTSRVSTGTISL